MTSIAMSAGMLASPLGVDEGGSFCTAMATVVICGTIVSTVLSLEVVPSCFLTLAECGSAGPIGWSATVSCLRHF